MDKAPTDQSKANSILQLHLESTFQNIRTNSFYACWLALLIALEAINHHFHQLFHISIYNSKRRQHKLRSKIQFTIINKPEPQKWNNDPALCHVSFERLDHFRQVGDAVL